MTPEEEERLIENEFQDVLQGYLKSNHRKKVEIIERAFRFAKKAHGGIRRRSGEPYILHPIAVAKIASQEIGLGSTSICAALLHDVVEDTDYTVEDIERLFGSKIAQIVAGLTKISGGIFGEQASAQAENFRKLLLTMSEDIRVVLIKMADRLHNMRTLGSMAPAKQYKIAGETLYIYAPLAHRLGLFEIKTELEDLSFKYEHPKAYERISELIRQSEARRSAVYNDFATPILAALDKMNLRYEAKARLKSVYSIWRKMETKHVPFEEIYDLYAMRIIFDCDDPSQEKGICWSIYSAITDLYRLHPDRTRDWVSIPKANGYQALHLTVMGPDGNWVEVQIRSRRMDEIAEKGFAAHWKYKSGESDEESELNEWLRTIKDILDDPNPNAIDFLDTLKMNLFASEIAVFTPKGRVITMPADSSVLDVAFELHSEIGTHCIAGKVNHKLVPLSHRLQSGDQVEVLTSQSQTPKEEWLPFLATAKGRTRLKAALRKVQQPVIDSGKAIFDQYFKEREVEATNEIVTKMLAYYHLPSREALYMKLGQGSIDLSRYILKESPKTEQSLLSKLFRIKRTQQPQIVTVTPEKVNVKKTYALRCTDTERNYVLSDCCHPIPGDDVMGYVNDRGQVELHSLTCPRAQALKAAYGPRIVSTEWEQVKQKFLAEIRIEGVDRHGILQELTQMISNQLNIDIRSLHIDTDKEVFACSLTVLVSDTQVVGELCQKIKKIKGVQNAARVADTPD
ncbi:bifunctional (p)ppGpp synthetase/guanosine-3',5'-bis(diphosphate) 3'-pyrophosphohydrolase [Paramuribaculum intestinale]|uniref:Bifunctional (P)ppGpp synthetase/guanosine-3',5'-bis(Diphosphate) 3'-pyrophosphohydrolase n=2 Tax=Paramuribaculum intestinale TaxID=2094151 RepID=A0A2V1IWN3_9BACT|nr:RelA/SpoT family protein [Paramuribaculum intestinale]MBJ2185910.1 bifunctional (p)ppGpp synthetase/guanosine-3',5'-bis(diphosphate) 3'-pyrophosphohydrolase [Muribaculaceae bacterium]ROS93506.1 bifunctional (p)ppGpp synthetase/guanosine-3',5'-bis(diphosphate) 3'-pyrophosphohydrolase [Muribaculaceae bacterium Isolate-043 (Harlan)]ROT14468.1 bifunctional (p)ppGpp synthetase/guanosine-3',5'-bis(diphosphate) 3'-pyrophosphohydrolase [Muribaculaceae bacterium Isolate-105 (HZI)]RXE62515.1 bifunctio